MYYAMDRIMQGTHPEVNDSEEEESGGDKKVAQITIEQEDLDKKVADARAEGVSVGKTDGDKEGYERGLSEGLKAEDVLEKAVADGTHIPADQVEGIVAKRLMSEGRETRIASLPCDDDTKADFLAIADNEERYPLDADGETKFAESFKRWEASMKTASGDDGDEDDGDEDDDKKGEDAKKTASDKKGEDFDPGNGGGSGDSDPYDDFSKGIMEMEEEV
jgi:hypothetical protein